MPALRAIISAVYSLNNLLLCKVCSLQFLDLGSFMSMNDSSSIFTLRKSDTKLYNTYP